MAKLDLFDHQWLEVVFAQKNKDYGAYELRQLNGRNTVKSLLIASTIFIFLFLVPKIYSLLYGYTPDDSRYQTPVTTIQDPPPINPKVQTPPPMEPPPARDKQVRFLPPIVRPDDVVRDLAPPTKKDLENANPGQKNIDGDPTGEIVQISAAGNGPPQAGIVEDTRLYDIQTIEYPPTYPGGMDKFYKYLGEAIQYPPMARENGVQGTVRVSFTIEKNGAITDVKVNDKSLGYGLEEEAIRVIKGSKTWNPGMQNGHPVRVRYNIPIKFNMPQ